MKKLMLASVILASGQMTMAANWVLSSSNVINQTVYIDFDSIKGHYFDNGSKSKYYVTAWQRKLYHKNQRGSDGSYYNLDQALWYIDCIDKKWQIGDVAYYKDSNVVWSGKDSYFSTYSSSNWNEAIPDTVAEQMIKEVCALYQLKPISSN